MAFVLGVHLDDVTILDAEALDAELQDRVDLLFDRQRGVRGDCVELSPVRLAGSGCVLGSITGVHLAADRGDPGVLASLLEDGPGELTGDHVAVARAQRRFPAVGPGRLDLLECVGDVTAVPLEKALGQAKLAQLFVGVPGQFAQRFVPPFEGAGPGRDEDAVVERVEKRHRLHDVVLQIGVLADPVPAAGSLRNLANRAHCLVSVLSAARNVASIILSIDKYGAHRRYLLHRRGAR